MAELIRPRAVHGSTLKGELLSLTFDGDISTRIVKRNRMASYAQEVGADITDHVSPDDGIEIEFERGLS
jgi:hypothetical protein